MIRPFLFKTLWMNAFIAVLSAIAFAIALGVGSSTFIGWFLAILFALASAYGLLTLFKEIMKLPINQAVIDAFNSKLKPGKSPVTQANLTKIQKIQFRLMKTTLPIQVVSLASLGAIALMVLISAISVIGGGAGGPTTTITGVWSHELGTINGSSWIMTITMWNVEETDPGFVYMNVSENGTFNVTYNDAVLSTGSWEEQGSDNYYFVYNDPDEILSSVSYDYKIRGNNLASTVDPNYIYFNKE